MKRSLSATKLVLLALVASVALSGCLAATHPLTARDRSNAESPLVGYWHGLISNSYQSNKLQIWSIYYFGGGHLTGVMSSNKAYPKEDFGEIKADDDTSLFDIYTSTIGEKTYFTLKPIRGTDMRDYLILKFELSGDKLSVYNISDAAIKKAVESDQLKGRQDGGSYLITSKSSDMNQWLETLSDGDFEPYATFERSELDPRELTHHLLSIIPSEA